MAYIVMAYIIMAFYGQMEREEEIKLAQRKPALSADMEAYIKSKMSTYSGQHYLRANTTYGPTLLTGQHYLLANIICWPTLLNFDRWHQYCLVSILL